MAANYRNPALHGSNSPRDEETIDSAPPGFRIINGKLRRIIGGRGENAAPMSEAGKSSGLYKPSYRERETQAENWRNLPPAERAGAQERQSQDDYVRGFNRGGSAVAGMRSEPPSVATKPLPKRGAGGDVYDTGSGKRVLASKYGTGSSTTSSATPMADKAVAQARESLSKLDIPGMAPMSAKAKSATPKGPNASGDELRRMIAQGRASVPGRARSASAEVEKSAMVMRPKETPMPASPTIANVKTAPRSEPFVAPLRRQPSKEDVVFKQALADRKQRMDTVRKEREEADTFRRSFDEQNAKNELKEASKSPLEQLASTAGKYASKASSAVGGMISDSPAMRGLRALTSPADAKKKKAAEERLKKLQNS